MNKFSYISGLVLALLLSMGLNGCGSEEGDGEGEPDYRTHLHTSYTINLKQDEGIIAGYGCTGATVRDLYGNIIGTSNPWISGPNIPNPLNSGEYKVEFSELFTHGDSKGILYYLSSGMSVPTLQLNTQIYLPVRTGDIYKLNVSEISSYTRSTSKVSISLFDSSLNRISLTNPITLNPGTYYLVASPSYCTDTGNGSFSVTKY